MFRALICSRQPRVGAHVATVDRARSVLRGNLRPVAIAALLVAIGSLIATAIGLTFARKAAGAANIANRIEIDRRHAELRPRYEVTCLPQVGTDRQTLKVKLLGPGELESVDEVKVTIRDESVFRLKLPGAADEVWGPYRFVPGTGPGVGTRGGSGADAAGRVTTSEGMPVGEAHLYALEPSLPSRNHTPDTWRQQVGTTLRLRIDTRKDGLDPWVAVGEVETTDEGPRSIELV